MDSNKISVSDRRIDISHLSSLRVLRMDHNRIDNMDRIRLPWSLRHFSMRGNQIDTLSLGIYNKFPLLNVLDLGLNGIDKLEGDLSNVIPQSVNVLKLDMNNITMQRVTFPMTLQHIDLTNNPKDGMDVVNLKQLLTAGLHIEVDGDQQIQSRYKMQMEHLIPRSVFDQNRTSANLECRICCEQIVTGEEIKTLPCMHLFHCQCIDQWASEKGNCPECRHRIDDIDHTES